MPNGFSGVLTGAAIVFFTYIGFDSVSTAAEECRNPQRDLPFGILMTLLICTMLYVARGAGSDRREELEELNSAAPVADALRELGYHSVRSIVNLGALIGMLSSLLVFQYGQARVWFAMSRDRLLARSVLPRSSGSQDTVRQHLGRRSVRGDSGRHLGCGYLRRPVEHRNSVRVRDCFGRRDCGTQA